MSSSRPDSGLPARADEAARVHVDDGERLRVVEDEVSAGGEVDPPCERGTDLRVDAESLEERRLLAIAVNALDHVRRGLLQVADDPAMGSVVVDLRADEVAREQVADDAKRELGFLVDQLGGGGFLGLRLDRLPEALEEDEVALDVFGGRALRGGAHDDPSALRVELSHDLLEPGALLVFESPRDSHALAVRDVDEEAPGQRELGGQAGALRLHRILDRLHEHGLAALDQVLDLARALATLELGADDLVDIQEPVLLEADLDERGLHPWEDVVDHAEVDVPGDRAPFGPFEIDLGDAVVLEDGDALLPDVGGDQELALRLRQRRAPRRGPAARAALRLAIGGGALRLALRRLALDLGVCRRTGLVDGSPGCFAGGRLLAPASSAASAAALPLRCLGGLAAFRGRYCRL